RHRTEGPLVSGSGLRSRLSSRLHGSDHPFGVVWAIVPVKDDLRDIHVSTLDREPHGLDVLLFPFPLFGSDPHAWIGGLDRLLAEHEPLVLRAGRAHGTQQDDGRNAEGYQVSYLHHSPFLSGLRQPGIGSRLPLARILGERSGYPSSRRKGIR